MINTKTLLAAGVLLLIPAAVIAVYYLRNKRRATLRQTEIPSEWAEFLNKRLPIYTQLPAALKQQLHGLINVFLDEIDFVGCANLEITDEIRVTVAGQACILLLNRETNYYSGLKTIYIYPHTYIQNTPSSVNGSIVSEEAVACEGEAWQHGPVVLTWDNIVHGASDAKDGHNVVLHEFAHKLDQESGSGNGTPILEHSSQYIAWGRILGEEYKELCESADKHKRHVMNLYGATNAAEFFAVATETFFEKPRQLKQKHSELYDALKEYYQLDPLSW